MSKTMPFKPYTIAMVGDNDAEISMYGEVVEKRPTDWWTGEPVPGNFIALDDFLRDLDDLGTKDNITIHINSVGGSLYAGLAIYNRLRALSANVTTINDALAASAASIIFQAGNIRKVNAGSNLMIHEAASFLYGYYQVKDLKDGIKYLEAHNKTAVAAYAERTGRDADSIKNLLAKETWMTGQEAVDAGFADEVITSGEDVSMSLTPDKRFIVSNGVAMSTRGMNIMPAAAAMMTAEEWAELSTPKNGGEPPQNSANPAQQASNNTHQIGGMNEMEIKNGEDLRKAYPEFTAQIENAARADGINAERERIQGIEGIQNVVGDAEMVKNAKYGENPIDAKELVYQAAMANAMAGGKTLAGMMADAQNSGAEDVVATPAPAGEEPKMTDDEKAEALLLGAVKNMKEGK